MKNLLAIFLLLIAISTVRSQTTPDTSWYPVSTISTGQMSMAIDGNTVSTAELIELYPDAFFQTQRGFVLPRNTPLNTDTLAYCLAVHDGDSYKFRYTVTIPDTAELIEWVRIEGIDCDEIYSPYCPMPQPFGKTAGDSIRKILKFQYAYLVVSGRDKYGRTLAQVWLDGKDLALTILEKGYAQYYYPNTLDKETRKRYQKARDRAKKRKLGRWANPDVIDPVQWRAIMKK